MCINRIVWETEITSEYLRQNPDQYFVFGDNLLRQGKGGAAKLRDEPNALGFVTKKCPSMNGSAYFTPVEYVDIYRVEMSKLKQFIREHPQHRFLISKIGAGLANRFHIWEKVIYPNIYNDLDEFGDRIIYLFY